jgi:DNA ligase-1
MENTVIYKRTKTGAIQQWQQQRLENKFRTISGQVDGALVFSDWTVCEPTNVGRANERSAVEQAIFEINSNYKKKLDKDYHLSIDNIDKQKVFIPMLAKDFKDYRHLVLKQDSVFVQPKIDGMRCIATKDGLFSRNGKEIISTPHIYETLKSLFNDNPDLILDGELYNHQCKDNFNAIISLTKKTKPSEEDLKISAEIIQYHVYDIAGCSHTSFKLRIENLQNIVDKLSSHVIKLVDTYECKSSEELDEYYYNHFLENGYEGQMIRLNVPYETDRTKNLLKRKETITEEFVLVDIQPGLGNWAGKAKRAILKNKDGSLFGAGIKGTMEFCADILENKEKYLDKLATVEYFALTPDGVPRFGRVKEFAREDI